MIKMTILALAGLLQMAPASAAQLYRWVDENGRVEWRDTPPPAAAKKVERRNVGGNTIETSSLPYSVQQAVRNFPVTLWTFDCGDPCNRARTHLARRGIPYTERSVTNEQDAFQKLTGGTMEAPLLIVGNTRIKGYLESDWDNALDAAGYPRTPPPGVKATVKPVATSSAKPAPSDAQGSAKPAADAAQPATPVAQ